MSQTETENTAPRALLALALLVPAPSIGVSMMLFIAPGVVGSVATAVCKVWILVLPVAWLAWVDKGKPTIPKPTWVGMIPATLLGLGMFSVMLGAFYGFARDWIDPELVRQKAERIFIDTPLSYSLLFSFLILLNSLLEEYVWRWFVFRKCEVLMPSRLAVPVSAGLFTLHHIIAVGAWVPWHANILASLGVFVGGCVWSGLYLKYRSIWPAYVCHIFADIAIFIMGWHLIFG